MKIAKRAEQKNIMLDMARYTNYEIKEMLRNDEAFFFEGTKISYDAETYGYYNSTEVRVFTANLSEIKVVLDDGFYTTVAIGKNGKTYFVSL